MLMLMHVAVTQATPVLVIVTVTTTACLKLHLILLAELLNMFQVSFVMLKSVSVSIELATLCSYP